MKLRPPVFRASHAYWHVGCADDGFASPEKVGNARFIGLTGRRNDSTDDGGLWRGADRHCTSDVEMVMPMQDWRGESV
jgi:hypothetical protein